MSPLDLLQSGQILAFVLLGIAIIEAIALHEYAHALVADIQGDRLPRAMGRLSLNPVRHLDPLGTILIFIVGFGWGKPVEFRPQAFTSQRFGSALVALAGPGMNLLLAFLGALVFGVVRTTVPEFVLQFLVLFAAINVVLAVFNLIPIPPLDGSRLLTIFLPPNKQQIIFFLDRYGFLILLALLFFGRAAFLFPVIEWATHAIFSLAGSSDLFTNP
ncbi:MAG: site-2 protease family protein [Actinomycetota bacterium]